jgi:glutathione S-transferase
MIAGTARLLDSARRAPDHREMPTLHYHPFSSFCQKVLIALYERELPFERVIVDLGDPEQRAALRRLSAFGKFPVLEDPAHRVTLAESSIIIEHLDRTAAGGDTLIPADAEAALQVRLWDRIFDLYVELPLQKAVGDSMRPAERSDRHGVEEAKATLATAYELIDAQLARGSEWIVGDGFTLADCGAAPALVYSNMIVPISGHARLEAYFERLLARPSVARTLEEARPYRSFFPLGWPEGYL